MLDIYYNYKGKDIQCTASNLCNAFENMPKETIDIQIENDEGVILFYDDYDEFENTIIAHYMMAQIKKNKVVA